MKIRIDININDEIHFKLTDHGKQIYRKYLIELNEVMKESGAKSLYNVEKEVKKFNKTQLWNFMDIFASEMHMGASPTIKDNNIFIKVDE